MYRQSYLENDEIIHLDLARPHVGTNGRQILVNVFHNVLRRFPRQDLIQDISTESSSCASKRNTEITHCETFLDKAQYSLRFMSRPLTSVDVRDPSSILMAAYFFFCRRSKRANTPSKSISRSLYRSLTAFLKSTEILRASESSVTLELTKTESVSP